MAASGWLTDLRQLSSPVSSSDPRLSAPANAPTAAGGRTAASAAAAERSALRDFRSQARFWGVAAAGLSLDLWSKDWAFRTLGQYGRQPLIPHVLEFQTMMNDGALFGIGSGRTTLLLAASVAALVLVLWLFASSEPRSRLLHVAFGAVLAGAAGNMYDRMFVRLVTMPAPSGAPRYFVMADHPDGQHVLLREYPPRADLPPLVMPKTSAARLGPAVGHVRDFIKIPTRFFGGRELWPWVFNVADVLLVGGVGLLAVRVWRERAAAPRATSPGPAARA